MGQSTRSSETDMELNITKLINHPVVVPGLLGVSIFSAGVAAGVLLERLVEKPKESADIPAEENDHPRLFDPDDPPTQERLVITLDEALAMRAQEANEEALASSAEILFKEETEATEDYEPPTHIPEVMAEKTASRIDPPEAVPDAAPVPFNVLDAAEPDEWDWDTEMVKREANPEGPYQIHEEEYASRSMGFHVSPLLYYAVDQIVCDQNDPRDMMYDYAAKLGDFKFGYGATDVDTAFVRNPMERTDYQIVQMHDSYSESVMGIVYEDEAEQSELAHMDQPLRMRRLE